MSVLVTDSVTGQPLSSSLALTVSRFGSEAAPVQTDATGKGSVCFSDPASAGALPGPPPPGNASVTFTSSGFVLVHGAGGDYTTSGSSNTVSAPFSPPAPTPATALSLTATANPTSLEVGQAGSIDLKVTNLYAGPTQTVTLGVSFSGDVPTIASVTSDSGSCSGTSTVSCTFASIAAGGQANVELKVEPTTSGTIAAAVTVTGTVSDTRLASLHSTSTASGAVSIVVSAPAPPAVATADLSLRLRAARTRATVGKATTVTATVANAGPKSAAGTSVTFRLPAGLRLSKLGGGKAICSVARRSCTIATLGTSTPVSIVLTLVPGKTGRQSVSARVKPVGITDPVLGNDSAKLVLSVHAAAR